MQFFLLCAARGAKKTAEVINYKLRVGDYPEENGEHKRARALIKMYLQMEQVLIHEYLRRGMGL